jgi:glycosyltransferase involved in cell wall biosynthesis
MQALATGLPSIVTKHSGFPDQVIEGKNGFLVDEGDYRTLAQRILDYIAHPESWGDMSDFSREHIKRTYDSSVLVDRQITLYTSLITA